MSKPSVPERPEPLPRKRKSHILWVTAFLVAAILAGWIVTIDDVLKEGFAGAQEGVGAIIASSEEISDQSGVSGAEVVDSISDLTKSLQKGVETAQETTEIVGDVVEALPEVIEQHEEKEETQKQEEETQAINNVLDLTQEILQAE